MADPLVDSQMIQRLLGLATGVRPYEAPLPTAADYDLTPQGYSYPGELPGTATMAPMARVPLQQFDIPAERAPEVIRSRGLAAQVSPSFHGRNVMTNFQRPTPTMVSPSFHGRNVMGAAEGPMLDGLPAGALFEGYADPTGLEVVSGPSLGPGREQIIRAQRMQAIMEERRRAEALAAEEIARRDYESFIGPDQPLRATDMYAVPQGFPSQAPGDQGARYDELLRKIAPLQVRSQAADPIQDAADEAVLLQRLNALGR